MSISKFLFLLIVILIESGCSHRRLKPHHHMINNQFNQNYQQSMPLHISTNMQDLDRSGRETKPFYVSSMPQNINPGSDKNLINLQPYIYSILHILNITRTTQGDYYHNQPLSYNFFLSKAAKNHAVDMGVNHFMSHIGSGTAYDFARKAPGVGSNFYERIIFFGYPVRGGELTSEIIAYTKFSIVRSQEPMLHFKHAIDNFLRSPKHRSILLNPNFKNFGIAAYKTNEGIYWVLLFAQQATPINS